MKLLETILQNPALISQMASTLGLGEKDTRAAAEQMIPALSRGIRRNAAKPGGLDALLGALKSGGHQRYVDHPDELGGADTINDGNSILGHILGSKDASRNVAGYASSKTGLDSGILKKMLPILAATVMGSLGKQVTGGGGLSSLGAATRGGDTSPMISMLEGFLDSDRDGSVVDDLIGLAKRFF